MNFATEVFRSLTCAEPQRVWDELTTTGRPLGWLYGMVVESTWQSGASVRVGIDESHSLVGEVLNVDRAHRLSFSLGDLLGDPSVFVTWELARVSDTTILRLTVDEAQPPGDDSHEIELAWLPAILSLTALLANGGTTAKIEPKDAQN